MEIEESDENIGKLIAQYHAPLVEEQERAKRP